MQVTFKYYTIFLWGKHIQYFFYCFVFITQQPGFGPGFQRVCYYTFLVIVYFEKYFHSVPGNGKAIFKDFIQKISLLFFQGISYTDFMKFIPKRMARNAKETHMKIL